MSASSKRLSSKKSVSDYDWAGDYIDPAQIPPPSPPTEDSGGESSTDSDSDDGEDPHGFCNLPGPRYDDLQPAAESDYEMEMLLELIDVEKRVPDDTVFALNCLDRISNYLNKQFKRMPATCDKFTEDDIDLVLQQLQALLRYTSELCKRFGQRPLDYRETGGVGGIKLVRSSYQFCANSASCTQDRCPRHHYVFDKLHGDIYSLFRYISGNRGSWDVASATVSVTTIDFVVSHMLHEYQDRKTVQLYKQTISSSHRFQGGQSYSVVAASSLPATGSRELTVSAKPMETEPTIEEIAAHTTSVEQDGAEQWVRVEKRRGANTARRHTQHARRRA
jgi:hypothetical protein